ncbi:MAG: hypothetical protein CMJ18_27330 [Phycisphaeraceae bacterium]|nr:hypothetical protein [Phycisphaeraceae bacterium]
MTLYADALDGSEAQMYGHRGFVYESMWIGLLRVMRNTYVPGSRKQTTIELTSSRDGRHWSRVGRREQVIPLGPAESWDPHYHDPFSPPLLVGDRLWIYYRSMPLLERSNPQAGERKIARIGLATLRRDGFASLDAGDETGLVVTRPLTFEPGRLHVNAVMSDGGSLRAEVRDVDGNPVEPFTLARCTALTGDRAEGVISWNDESTLRREDDQSLRIAFELRNARLYSFWIE